MFFPTAAQIAPPTDGTQVGYSNGGPVSQVLSAVLTANTIYTLKADFFARIDCCACLGSELDLMAGSTILSSALAGNPNLGQALQIRINTLGNPSGSQIDFDNVRQDGTLSGVPEPWSLPLLALAGAVLTTLKKLRA